MEIPAEVSDSPGFVGDDIVNDDSLASDVDLNDQHQIF